MSNTIFDEKFTNLYELSKTLRFELVPQGKTLENMREHLEYDHKLQTFFADQKIKDAYQTLKPIFDYLHQQFITESLEQKEIQALNFFEYFEKYQHRKDLKENELAKIEKILRKAFEKVYLKTAIDWKIKAGKNEKGKDVLKEKGYKILTEKGILEYIKGKAKYFSEIKSEEEILEALKAFEGFFTYLGGFNQNRENYYETTKEASTAVATRIVNENLPKFCDNVLFFESSKETYLNIFTELQSLGKNLADKDNKKLFPISENIFQINYFNQCFSQKQIEAYNAQIANANFLINLYNQAKNKEAGFKKLSIFKTLYKQIGCGKRDSLFFTLNCDRKEEAEKIKKEGKDAVSLEEIINQAKLAGEKYFLGETKEGTIKTVNDFTKFLKNRENYEGIYWSKMAINTISNKFFANWHDVEDKLKKAKVFETKNDAEENTKIPEAVELESFFETLNKEKDWKKSLFKKSILEAEDKSKLIVDAKNPSQALLDLIFQDLINHSLKFLNQRENIKKIKEYKNKENKELIKAWLDEALAINRILKYFLVKESKIKNPIDATLSQGLEMLLRSEDALWFKWYDAVRNYLTKKPQDDVRENKLKLNFENGTLAKGWDVNKEPDNYCVILQNQEEKQFLAIIAKQKEKGFNKLFEKNKNNPLYKIGENEIWKKVDYKLLPGPNKMLPKCLLPKSERTKYGASEKVLALYDKGSFKKSNNSFSTQDLHELINFYKRAIKLYDNWRCFNFSFSPTTDYADISQFYSEVEKQGYKLDFININKSIIDEWVEQGKIYLFELKNQDSNQGKKKGHKNNLHTLYWKALFQDIKNRPKLNGEAELFYRKAVPVEKLEKIKDKNGREIIKNFRYSKEKFFFHVPITLNFCFKNQKVNDLVATTLAKNDDMYFLGIDRGEKHLFYYSLINKDGKIIEQDTLNMPFTNADGSLRTVKAEKHSIKDGKEIIEIVECQNYNDLLEARAGDREYAKKNWQTIGNIKELKNGYISQVVRKIADLAIKYNAFVVLEDLNTGFKRGRQKIEKSVYQKFELALAKKLNFLVDKTLPNGKVGSVTKALQLTPPVTNYGDIENRKQVGIMLYTRANYTSQTDPITGWRKSIYLKTGSEENIKKQILYNFSEIGFDGNDYYFVYNDKNTDKEWKLYSGKNGTGLDRFRGKRGSDKNEWIIEKQKDIREMLDEIFANFDKQKSLHSQIKEGIELSKINDHTAWESLRFAIDLIQQIRNTGIKKENNDFILSPVRDQNGNHFDSRKATKSEPDSGDANGAYNIARKGIIMAEHIKRGISPFIFDSEWDAWLAGKDTWEEWLKKNAQKIKKTKKELPVSIDIDKIKLKNT